ncbi:Rhs family protein, partial [Pseudomonas syringae pv. actinidiae ICMP 19096]
FYYQLDHLGTPQELTDYSGEIMWSAKYRAYGNLATLDKYPRHKPHLAKNEDWV